MEPEPREAVHSRVYFQRVLKAATHANPTALERGLLRLENRVVHVVVEAERDEDFYLIASRGRAAVRARRPPEGVDITVRVSPRVIRAILEGEETPVEAFFLGHLRAKGITRDLYALHAFLVGMGEIAVNSSEIQEIVEEFQASKEPL